jgi:hypothetical protein
MMEHMKNTIAEATKITITVGIAFEYLNLVVNPFGKTVGVRDNQTNLEYLLTSESWYLHKQQILKDHCFVRP